MQPLRDVLNPLSEALLLPPWCTQQVGDLWPHALQTYTRVMLLPGVTACRPGPPGQRELGNKHSHQHEQDDPAGLLLPQGHQCA